MKKLFLALTASAFLMQPFNPMPVEYPKTGIVTAVNIITDTVTVADCNGTLWEFSGVRDYEEKDIISMVMSDNGTPLNVYDDTIIKVRYGGGVRQLLEAYNASK